MEDLSTFVWLGIAILWFLSRIVRRGVKKAAGSPEKKQPAAASQASRPAAPAATGPREPLTGRFRGQQDFSGRGGTGPPPIVPR